LRRGIVSSVSAVIMNMCLFGAVTAGPLIGGAQASFHAWRPLFWIVAGIAGTGLVMSLLTFQDAPPADRTAPRDPAALGLAASGSVAAFWGASELTTHRFLAPVAVIPLLAGLALLAVLLVYQYRARRPMLMLRSLASTIPVAGVVVAICAAAASTSALGLTVAVLTPHYAPLHPAWAPPGRQRGRRCRGPLAEARADRSRPRRSRHPRPRSRASDQPIPDHPLRSAQPGRREAEEQRRRGRDQQQARAQALQDVPGDEHRRARRAAEQAVSAYAPFLDACRLVRASRTQRGLAPSPHQRKFGLSQIFSRRYFCTCAM
jgi:hypothetical protein